ncbi:hypothetical protein [Dellaglioa carnosa]|uniref:hypothetical protein n=1 Tax=Dellaglioa carnosa TaxID=2995136 RepID=UPI0022A89005|nr:hypothetical protein [Dellaglioa carnosa]MCZ2492854.1 hypothetical protein [Dellaglioa carnosa]
MINLGGSNLQVSVVGLGRMRMSELSMGQAKEIFAAGSSETKLSREDIILQSKCGIASGLEYKFTAEHIDSLLLHGPDTLIA